LLRPVHPINPHRSGPWLVQPVQPMLSLSLNTPPQAQLEALRALRLFGSSWLHALSAFAVASSGSGFPSWVHSPGIRSSVRFCIGLRLSFILVLSAGFAHPARSSFVSGLMSRFPDIFRLSRTSDVFERVGSSGSLVFRHFPDGSGPQLFRVPEFSGIPTFRRFGIFRNIGILRSIDPSGRHRPSFWSASTLLVRFLAIVTELPQERWDTGDKGRDDERDRDNIRQALIPVTGVVPLDSTQGEHKYLYKNVRACMELE
jgi:hypothetical protein